MKITNQVALYFAVLFALILVGMLLIVNRMNVMDSAHHQVIEEWEELKTVTMVINEIDRLGVILTTEGEESFLNQFDRSFFETMVSELDMIRASSLNATNFENDDHALTERKEFFQLHEKFRNFLEDVQIMKESRGLYIEGEVVNQMIRKLDELRVSSLTLQDFYIDEMKEASDKANLTHRQVVERSRVFMFLFMCVLLALFIWFISLTNRNSKMLSDQQRNTTIGLLAQSLSHEIRNPLGIIKSSTSVIRDKLPADSEEYEIAGYLGEEADRISSLIDQLRQLQTSEEGEMSEVNVVQLLEQIRKLVVGVSQRKQIVIDFKSTTSDLQIKCHRNQIKQVLINVILNAIDASDVNGKVQVNASLTGHMVCIIVHNHGGSLRKSDWPRVFDPFFTTKENGSGLGLYVAKSIIDGHKGSINLESDEINGTRVTIKLKHSGPKV